MIVKCLYCKKEFSVYPSQIKKGGGKYCSMSCRATHRNIIDNPVNKPGVKDKISKNHADVSGKNNPMYGRKGNKAPSYKDGRNSFGGGYRGKGLINLQNSCFLCGESNINKLVVHHKDENRQNNKLNNLQIVCYKCHNTIIHKKNNNNYGQFVKK
jgi:hypothetical protein